MKKTFIGLLTVLMCLVLSLALFACDSENDDNINNGLVDDGYGNLRPSECWLSDCVFSKSSPSEYFLKSWFGNLGDAGLLSESALEFGNETISVNSSHYLVCLFYGNIADISDLSVYLQFMFVSGKDVLYDNDCVNVQSVDIYSDSANFDVIYDMRKNASARASITLKHSAYGENELSSNVVSGCLVVKFKTVVDIYGTMYGCLSVDNANASQTNHTVDIFTTTAVGTRTNAEKEIRVTDFSTGYLSEWAYNDGNFSDRYLTDEPDYENDSKCYMVLDFTFESNHNADKVEYVYLLASVPQEDVLTATIDEAPTGDIYEHVVNNTTLIFARYAVPINAGESKTVRMVLKLVSVASGASNVNVLVVSDDGIVTGKGFVSKRMNFGKQSLKYTLSDDGTYYIASDLWDHNVDEIIIPDNYLGLPVKQVANSLFVNNTKVQTVVFGNNVQWVAESAFANCLALQNVTFGSSITALPNKLFKGCEKLRHVVVTATEISAIGESCFEGCTSLAEISGIESVTRIDSRAFYDCSSLAQLDFVGVADIGSHSFHGCSSLESVGNITGTSIADYAFYDCSKLVSVSCPNAIVIGDYSFAYCSSLAEFDFSVVTKRIGKGAFLNCSSLTSIDLAESYVLLYEYAFAGTSGVRALNLGGAYFDRPQWLYDYFDLTSVESISVSENSTFKVENNCLLARSEGEYTIVKLGCKNSVIPQNTKYIGRGAFYGCVGLTEITIPSSVQEIDIDAFNGCTGLETVYISVDVHVNDTAFANCGNYKMVRP